MIPAMAVMAGAYIILRCLEMMLRPTSSWGSGTARTLMIAASVLVIVLTFWQVAEILMAGVGLAREFGR